MDEIWNNCRTYNHQRFAMKQLNICIHWLKVHILLSHSVSKELIQFCHFVKLTSDFGSTSQLQYLCHVQQITKMIIPGYWLGRIDHIPLLGTITVTRKTALFTNKQNTPANCHYQTSVLGWVQNPVTISFLNGWAEKWTLALGASCDTKSGHEQ